MGKNCDEVVSRTGWWRRRFDEMEEGVVWMLRSLELEDAVFDIDVQCMIWSWIWCGCDGRIWKIR